jgi:diguanylate cyclase
MSMGFATQQCISTPIGVGLILLYLRHEPQALLRYVWLGFAVAATGVQIASIVAYRRHSRRIGHPDRWVPAHVAAFVVGTLWGVTPLMNPTHSPITRAVALLFVTCALASNVTTVGGWQLFACFHVPVGALSLSSFALPGNDDTAVWVLGTVVWLVTTVGTYRYVESQHRRADNLNHRLAAALSSAKHEATHDALTGLPNRRMITTAIDNALSQAEPAILLFIDLDEFKLVNDSLGHEGGDVLLQHTSARLRHVVPPDHLVARLGGDEFAVLVVGSTLPMATDLGHRIIACLREPFTIGPKLITVGASVGLAEATCDTSTSDLLKCADRAMYDAKKQGRNRLASSNGIDREAPMPEESGRLA